MQKISLFHQFIVGIQTSVEPKGRSVHIFDQVHPQILSWFKFLWIRINIQKIRIFQQFVLFHLCIPFSPKNPALSATSYGFLKPFRNLEKNWRCSSKKKKTAGRTERRTEGQTDRPYSVGPFWLSPEVQVSSSQAKAKSTANTNRISCSASWKKFQVSNWAINRPLYGVKRFRDTHKKWIKIFSLIKL